MVSKSVKFLLMIFVLGLLLRVYNIYTTQYWFDEAYSDSAARRPVAFLFENPMPDVHPPGSFIFLRAWYFLVGFDDPYKSRWLSLIFGMAFIPTIFFVAKNWFNERAAKLAAFLSATSLTFIVYSVEARMYVFIMLFSLLAMYFLKEAIERGSWVLWFWFVFFAALSEYFHYYAVFLMIPVMFFAVILKAEWKKFFASMLLYGAMILPAVIYFFFQSYGIEKMWLRKPFFMSWISAPAFQFFIPSTQAFSNFQLPSTLWGILPFLGFFMLFGMIFFVSYKKPLNKAMLWSWAALIVLVLALAYFPPNIPYHHRFLLLAAPLLYLLLAQAFDNCFNYHKILGYTMVFVWVFTQGFMYVSYFSHVDQELKHASQFFQDKCPAVVVHESPFSMLPLRSTNPECRHILQTTLSRNSMRTGGGSVIDDRDFNNASVKYDYYVYGDLMLNCSTVVGRAGRVVLNACLTVPRSNTSYYADGEVVFYDNGLVVRKVSKVLIPAPNVSMDVRKFVTTGSALHKFLFGS